VSEGVGDARPEAEGELALARLALDAGEFSHAAAHTGNAIASDPSFRPAYDVVDELASLVTDADTLFPLDGIRIFAGAVAARSYLAARAGKLDNAFDLLCRLAEGEPGKPWTAGWLAVPDTSMRELAGRMNLNRAVACMRRLSLSLPDPVDPQPAEALRAFLDLARVVVTTHPEPAKALTPLSGLARRLGEHKEAIAWCERAEAIAPSSLTAIMLGYALRSSGRLEESHKAWLTALRRDPGNVNLRVDIAEQLARRGRLDEGIGWLDEALKLEPEHPKAFPSACQMRYEKDDDVAHLVRLADWWRAHPEHVYADNRLATACSGKSWLSLVPPPAEAICNMVVSMAKEHPEPESLRDVKLKCTLSALEVPSAITAMKAMIPGMQIAPAPTPAPDIRVPVAEGRYRLWTYQGTEAVPVVAAPSPEAVAALQGVATRGIWGHPLVAYDTAMPLSALSVDDLLGLLAHGVPVPDDSKPWQGMRAINPPYWPRFTQAWACLGLLHHQTDEPWPDSTRRRVLLDLIRGVEDWVTDAALNALVVAAWIDPGIRTEVTEVVGVRFVQAMQALQQREVTIATSLAQLVLITPGMPADATDLARTVIERRSAADTPARPDDAKPARRRFRRRSLAAHQLASRGRDVVRVDPGPGEQFLTRPGTRHLPHRQVDKLHVPLPRRQQRVRDRRTKPALRMVILGHHDPPAGRRQGRDQRLGVDGLDRVAVDDPRGDALSVQDRGGAQRLVQRHSRPHQRHLVRGTRTNQLRPAHPERLAGRVKPGEAAPRGAQVTDARRSGHRLDQRRRAGAVARVQHGRPVHGPHHRQVFQRHLRRPVGADLDPRVRPGQAQVHAGDRTHPDEIVGAGEERRERRRERAVPADGQPGGRGHQLLLGDEHLEVPLRVDVRELVRERRVAHLAVQHDDAVVARTEGDERVPVRLPGRHLGADLVLRRRRLNRRLRRQGRGLLGNRAG
jgi:tetratricopeptide (TPR) repeat protein